MTSTLVSIYHHLPSWMRSTAATLHGRHLRSWRFGAETPQLMSEALERDYWTADQWTQWQHERLSFVLNRAATRVPYYRDYWQQCGGGPTDWGELKNWPLLDKENVRANPRAFVADDCEPRKMFYGHTSGTTGTPIDLWRSKTTMRTLYALSTARTRGWNGVRPDDRWAKLGGQVVTPANQTQPPFWVWNAALNQLYMSSYHLSPEMIPHYLDAIAAHKTDYIFGYTSSVFALAQEMLRLNRHDIKLKVVITEAEPVFEHQRKAISQAFQCPLRETYGMGEIVSAASECPEGTLHQWPEIGVVETVDSDDAFGELICTSLLNSDMPLIRYRLGDRGRIDTSHACRCGRSLPSIEVAEAGSYDLLVTRDGRRILGLEDVFFNTPIRQAQIVQEKLDVIRARYVPTADFTPASARSIVKAVQARMQGVEVIMEPVDDIPRGANGKFWLQVCKVPQAEIEAAVAGRRASMA